MIDELQTENEIRTEIDRLFAMQKVVRTNNLIIKELRNLNEQSLDCVFINHLEAENLLYPKDLDKQIETLYGKIINRL